LGITATFNSIAAVIVVVVVVAMEEVLGWSLGKHDGWFTLEWEWVRLSIADNRY
jgi:hypothetical protein